MYDSYQFYSSNVLSTLNISMKKRPNKKMSEVNPNFFSTIYILEAFLSKKNNVLCPKSDF